ncbi:MAG: cob(I)yrinic acid a,c-diamide adenosyltransferase [Planctomycetes bacterium]|nr:cob(I)yrinic acid a,c-diamide adenosyltransferase [Planctomycetota bacterium]
MKIYTKTGDTGETGLFAGPRVRKDHPRIDAYGTVDELNAVLGMVRCETLAPGLDHLLDRVQNELFDLGAELATPDAERHGLRIIGEQQIAALEAAIDMYEGHLAPLRVFILPGGTRTAALLHLARTVCRRAERQVVQLSASEPLASELTIYLNRLSDLLFVVARWANHQANVPDVPWTSRKS